MKKKLLLICLLIPLVLTCKPDPVYKSQDYIPPDEMPPDDTFTYRFFAYDFVTNSSYKLWAALYVKGKYCNIYVEYNSKVTAAQAKEIADKYDNDIHEKMVETYSLKDFTFLDYQFSDILELADMLTDQDGKLTILLFDIKDGYQPNKTPYTAGYFWSGDFIESVYVPDSNERDMIYIDTYPGLTGPDFKDALYATLAHELQHLMNFTTSFVNRSSTNAGQLSISLMDTWIDEGLAEAAEWVFSGEYSKGRIESYNNDYSGLIQKGNNFFIWGNHGNNPYAILDDYSTANLFFQWIRLQAGSSGIYKDIITSDKLNHEAVTSALNNASPGNGFSDWSVLLKTWLAANYINAENGLYGYKKEITLEPKTAGTGKTIDLFPGEGVYSIIPQSFSMPSSSGNIRYSGLSSTPVDTAQQGDALLTFNVSTNYDKNGNYIDSPVAETGTITGFDSLAPAKKERSAIPAFPFRVDGILRMDKDFIFPGIEHKLKKDIIDE